MEASKISVRVAFSSRKIILLRDSSFSPAASVLSSFAGKDL
jgi:hypothetical protein